MIGVAELTWRILAVGAIAIWLSMAFRTSRIGVVAGRDSFMWLLYGLVFPGISLAHAYLLLRTRRRGPLKKAEISILPPSPFTTLRWPIGHGDQRLTFELYDPTERRQVNLGGTVTEVRREASGVIVLTCELIGPV